VSAPKLTEAQRELLRDIESSHGHWYTYHDEGDDHDAGYLAYLGLLSIHLRQVEGGADTKYWILTDAGRAALKGGES